ncbi:hypothetical protein HSB1_28910 [Halogranum salarium B-1]|uniref:Uncharacterized protein n=1 Tax=Halogranum salarium B-1 TaxID=1210908 RepID=J2ZDQ4_9EURY|nr:hypothetical protein HSB1_28910 [Halogranum salarium B-1]
MSQREVSTMGKFRKAMYAWRRLPRKTQRRIKRKGKRLFRKVRS